MERNKEYALFLGYVDNALWQEMLLNPEWSEEYFQRNFVKNWEIWLGTKCLCFGIVPSKRFVSHGVASKNLAVFSNSITLNQMRMNFLYRR